MTNEPFSVSVFSIRRIPIPISTSRCWSFITNSFKSAGVPIDVRVELFSGEQACLVEDLIGPVCPELLFQHVPEGELHQAVHFKTGHGAEAWPACPDIAKDLP